MYFSAVTVRNVLIWMNWLILLIVHSDSSSQTACTTSWKRSGRQSCGDFRSATVVSKNTRERRPQTVFVCYHCVNSSNTIWNMQPIIVITKYRAKATLPSYDQKPNVLNNQAISLISMSAHITVRKHCICSSGLRILVGSESGRRVRNNRAILSLSDLMAKQSIYLTSIQLPGAKLWPRKANRSTNRVGTCELIDLNIFLCVPSCPTGCVLLILLCDTLNVDNSSHEALQWL